MKKARHSTFPIVDILVAVLFLILGLWLLWTTYRYIELPELWNIITRISWEWIPLSMLFGYLAYVFRGLRWYLLIKPLGYEPKKSTLIHAIAFGYLFNAIIPRSGEVMRCTAVNRVHSIPVSKLFGHVLLERLIDFILLGFCIVLAIIFNYQDFITFSKGFETFEKAIYIYIVLGIIALIFLYKMRNKILPDRISHKINSFINGIKEGFLSIQDIKHKAIFSIYTILIWVCYLLMTVVCFYCFPETKHLNLGQGVFILVAGGFGMVMPTPAGIGSYHFFVVAALMAINIVHDIAAAFALVVHTSQTIMIIIAGGVAVIVLAYQRIDGFLKQTKNQDE